MFKNCIKIFLVLVLIIILAAAFFRNRLCKTFVYFATDKATGLKLSLEKINLNVLDNTLRMRGITLLNPPGFKTTTLCQAEEILIKYHLLDCLRGRFHLRQVKVKINEINIIRNEKGESNVSAFRKSLNRKANSPASSSLPTHSSQTIAATSSLQKKVKINKQPYPKFLIDRLEVSLAKVAFVNHQAETGRPAAIIVTTKGPFIFENVGNLNSVVNYVSANLFNNAAP